jgi:hypothetical protein
VRKELFNNNYPLYQGKNKANGDAIKQVVFVSVGFVCAQNKISSRQFADTNTLRKSVGCGLHRSIGLLKRDDSNSPLLISDKKLSDATNGLGNDNGKFCDVFTVYFTRFFTARISPSFYGIFNDIFTVFSPQKLQY